MSTIEEAMNSTSGAPMRQPHGMLYDAMTSMVYFSVCVGIIFFLTLSLIAILLYWYFYVRPNAKRNQHKKTIRYSPLHSDDEIEERKGQGPPVKQLHAPGVGSGQRSHSFDQSTPPTSSKGRQWSGVPISHHIDIAAGHLLLAYIEENKYRFDKEWESLVSYQPEYVTSNTAVMVGNKHKNRYPDILPYDHNRVVLSSSPSGSDYINASQIVDISPHNIKYIATQGPMQHTIVDYWQMIWDQSVSVIVMLTALSDIGLTQSCQYWPSNGVTKYEHFEIRLVSEHHHSEDYFVRSFFVLNLQLKTSRTITQFNFLTWSSTSTPLSPTPLLEFRRKVISANSQPNAPLLVHCSEGVGRTGTYILIDMTLTRISLGAKEINLAAAIEHLRDQRMQMVKTKAQFDFALNALVEETQMMLNAAQNR